jgi:hypothetical protein
VTEKPKRKKKPKPEVIKYLPAYRDKSALWFEHELEVEVVEPPPTEETGIVNAVKPKVDPRLVALSRELRDRWQEQAQRLVANAKHDIRRLMGAGLAPGGLQLPTGQKRIGTKAA